MAELSGDPYLIEVFNDPSRDLFDEVGDRLYGARAIGNKELRIRTKAYVYGTAYGREEYSVAAEFGIPVTEAKRGMDAWFSMIPDLVKWREGVRQSVLTDQDDLVNFFGRHRRFWLITRENKKDIIKEAYSYYPQSTANDICFDALVALRRSLDGTSAAIRIPVHDSLLVECPEEDADDVAALMKVTMQDAAKQFTERIPFKVDVERGPSWGDLE
jgi:DNA polymerase-1